MREAFGTAWCVMLGLLLWGMPKPGMAQAPQLVSYLEECLERLHPESMDALPDWEAKALQLAQQAEDTLFVWAQLGVQLRRLGAYAQADSLLSRAISYPSPRHPQRGIAHLYRALIHQKFGEYAQARRDYLGTIRNLRTSQEATHQRLLAYAYRALGNLLTQEGDYEGSQAYLSVSYALARQLGNEGYMNQALIDLGSCARYLGDAARAKRYFLRALEGAPSPRDQAMLYHNLGEVLTSQVQLDSAEQCFDRAMGLFRKLPGSEEWQAQVWAGRGAIAAQRQSWQQAEYNYTQALRLTQTPDVGPNRQRGKNYLALGKMFLEQGQAEKALANFHEALKAVLPEHTALPLDQNPDEEQLYAENVIMDALEGKLTTSWKLYEERGGTNWLWLGLDAAKKLGVVEDLIRNESREEAGKLRMAAERHQRTELMVRICHELQLNEQAMLFAERAKAQVLQDWQIRAEQLQPAPVLGARANTLERALARSQVMMDAALLSGHELSDSLLSAHVELRLQLDSINTMMKESDSMAALAAVPSLLLEDIQALLSDEDIMVSFFWGDAALYRFGITREALVFDRIAWKPGQQQAVKAFLQQLQQEGGKGGVEGLRTYETVALAVYEQLFGDVLGELGQEKRRLIVVPDHVLNLLPVEALVDVPVPAARWYHDLAFLVHRYAIQYAFSIQAWASPQGAVTVKVPYDFVGFAPVYASWRASYSDARSGTLLNALGQASLPPLRYNQQEVEALAEQFSGRAFLAEEATEATFFEYAPQGRVLHLSMHGFLHDTLPLLSGLAFSKVAQESAQATTYDPDHVLHAYELYGLRLSARLVVLSACQSGRGSLQPGEGVMSLARLFHLAGCPKLIASRWQVDDLATSVLMGKLYQQLHEGQPLPVALQRAKLTYLATRDKSHPYYWAAFCLSGNQQPVEVFADSSRAATRWPLLVLLLLVGLAGGGIYQMLQKRKKLPDEKV